MGDHNQIEEDAASWLARRDRAELSSEEEAAFGAWLEASLAHRVSYLRLKAAWDRTQRLRALEHSDALATQVNPQASPQADVSRAVLWRVCAVAACLLLSCILAWNGWQYWQSIYRTQIGAMRSVPLLDGSRVSMNTDSEIRVDSSNGYRKVDLRRGEAYFEVAKEDARPFIVRAGAATVEVVGTQFAVHRTHAAVSVLVTHGHVRLRPLAQKIQTADLYAGDKALVSDAGIEVLHISETEIEEALAWRRGMLVFRNTRLLDAVAEFNRYHETPIVIADPQLAQMRIGGTFRTANVSGFLRLLEEGFQVRAVSQSRAIVLTRG